MHDKEAINKKLLQLVNELLQQPTYCYHFTCFIINEAHWWHKEDDDYSQYYFLAILLVSLYIVTDRISLPGLISL